MNKLWKEECRFITARRGGRTFQAGWEARRSRGHSAPGGVPFAWLAWRDQLKATEDLDFVPEAVGPNQVLFGPGITQSHPGVENSLGSVWGMG